MKRYLRMSLWMALLTLILVIGVLAVPASAAEVAGGTCGENVTWVLDDAGTLTISGTGAMTDYAAASDSPWYNQRESITNIVIEDNVTSIGDRAFYNCTGLTEVTIGTGVTSIGNYAFRGCSALKNVTIPSGVTELKGSAFRLCSALETVHLDGNAPTAGDYAFTDCSASLEIQYFEGSTGFDSGLWKNLNCKAQHRGQWIISSPASCSATGSRYIDCSYCNRRITETISVLEHSYVEGICKHCSTVQILDSGYCGSGLTWELDALGNLRISGSGDMTYFMYYNDVPWAAYSDVIRNVEIGSYVTSIGRYAFYFCENLTSINIPDSITSIGKEAFCCCTNLPSITIPDSVGSIGDEAFMYCPGLKQISLPDSVTSLGDEAFYGCDSLTSVRLSSGLTVIGDGAFYSCDNLSTITIPDGITTIGNEVFYDCVELKNVSIPDSVSVIGEKTFYGCESLTAIDIPAGITEIGDEMFRGCTNLKNVKLPASVSSIGDSAFHFCESLTCITLPNNLTTIGEYAFAGCSRLTSISIPDSVTDIGYSAFSSCGSLTDVKLSNKITSIKTNTFYYCDSLTDIVIPDGVISIESEAFIYCTSLTDIDIPDTVTYMGDSVFRNCINLTNIELSDKLTRIGDSMFEGCNSLVNLEIPNTVTSIGNSAFLGCDKLTTVNIPNSVSSIGNHAFMGCISLTSIYIPDGVRTIGEYTFYMCNSLCEIRFSNNLTSIGEEAFRGCTKLTSIHLPSCLNSIGTCAFHSCGDLSTLIISSRNLDIQKNAFIGTYYKNLYFVGSKNDWDNMPNTPITTWEHYGYTNPEGHWSSYTVEVTCTDFGYTYDACPCGYETNYVNTPCRGHMKITELEGRDSSCTEPGLTKGSYCAACGDILVPQEEIKMLDHNYIDGICDVCGAEVPENDDSDVPEDPTESEPTEPEATEPEAPKTEGVTRLAGENRLVTSELIADQLKEQMGVEKFENIIIASGGTFADALPGSYLAAVKNAPILLTLPKDKFVEQTAEYIKANLVENGTVYILGGESAVPTLMETALTGINVKRVAGADRFGTNLAILKEAGVKAGDEILVCTAREFADSLSAAATGKPILLVYKKLTDDQKSYLETLIGNTFCVVGGTSAVPTSFEEELATYGEVTRLAGKDRLDTSVLVAEKYFPDATTSVVAYGWGFPDGLCGGSLAYAMDAPLILTHSKTKLAQFTADYTTKAGIKDGFVLGGDGLVDDAATRAIFSMGTAPITLIQ